MLFVRCLTCLLLVLEQAMGYPVQLYSASVWEKPDSMYAAIGAGRMHIYPEVGQRARTRSNARTEGPP